MSSHDPPDAELIRRSLAEPEAFGLVFDRLGAYARAAEHARRAAAPDVDGTVLRAVAALPRRQREVLLLAAWADLSYAEIARALDLPIGTVRSRLARARGRLEADPSLGPLPALADVKEASRA